MSNVNACPCGKTIPYLKCCGKIHKDMMNAVTAEDLMRSRYTAYTLADGNFLMKSHYSKTRPIQDKKEIVEWSKSVKWLRLEILNQTLGQTKDHSGTVEFKAYFMDEGEIDMIHENSKFIRENGHWIYVDMV
jgi:SEC-C motif-containing protein